MSAVATNAIAHYHLHTFHGTNKLADLLCPNRCMQPAGTNAVTQRKSLSSFFFFFHLGWEVVFYIPSSSPPMRTWLSTH